LTFRCILRFASGSCATVTNVNVRKLTAMSTGMLYRSLRTT
jgi:hypothetical protein